MVQSLRRPPRHGARLPARERRDQILRAFRDEALAVGSIAGVGIRGVVERAGCTAPVLYRIFGDRSGLVREAVRSTHVSLTARLEALAEARERNAEVRLRELAQSFLAKAPGPEEAFEALVNAECRSDPSLGRLLRQVFAGFELQLTAVVRDGIRQGEFRPDTDPAYVAWRLLDLGLFRNQAHLMRLSRPDKIQYGPRAIESLLAEIAS